jgi:hypothetical protein
MQIVVPCPTANQLDSLPLGDRCLAGVEGKEKSMGEGGGAAVSPICGGDREVAEVEALNAALTSWPRVEFVRMDRRWRGLKTVLD